MSSIVAVTGAGGFVGTRLCTALLAHGRHVRALVRRPGDAPPGTEEVVLGDLTASPDLVPALAGTGAVVHLAAATHAGDTTASAAWPRYRAINVEASTHLAAAALAANVRRFVYLSSIKVNGEDSGDGRFDPSSAAAPEDNYGRSKLAAELALTELFAAGATRLVVLRPPLVYGPGQKGNLERLVRWVARGRPLPFAGINNERSLVHVDNLAQAIAVALEAEAAGGVYTVSDCDLSTPALIRLIAAALDRPARLFYCPPGVLAALAGMAGRNEQWRRLSGTLLVDASRIARELRWRPVIAPAAGMRQAVLAWRAQQR